jgi:hypothetical protein
MRRFFAYAAAVLLLGLAAIWAVPPRAYACSCSEVSDVEHIDQADVIFTGQIVGDEADTQQRTLTFAVDRVYKGEAVSRQVIRTERNGAACGLEIAGPGSFVVFAYIEGGRPDELRANLCGGTRYGPAPASLGEGGPPQSGPSDPPDGSLTPSPTSDEPPPALRPRLLLVGVLAILIGVVIARRSRR